MDCYVREVKPAYQPGPARYNSSHLLVCESTSTRLSLDLAAMPTIQDGEKAKRDPGVNQENPPEQMVSASDSCTAAMYEIDSVR